MFFRRLHRRHRASPATEGALQIILSNGDSTEQYPRHVVKDLWDRVQARARPELERRLGADWASELTPGLILEGPGLYLHIVVRQTANRDLMTMGRVANEVFTRQWHRELADL